MTAANQTNAKRGGLPWWLVLIEGILAIIVGILLWIYPARTFVWLAFFIGIYWFISGIFDIVSIFFNRSMWGWKLFMGIVGILAGLFLINYQLRGATTLAYATAILLGVLGLFYGVLAIIRAFQGAGWGMGILGGVSMLFGIYILAHPLASTLVIPWLFGLLAIFGGILAIFGAFALRSAEKALKAAAARVSVPTMARTTQVGEVAAAPVAPAAGVAVAGAAIAATEMQAAEMPVAMVEVEKFEEVVVETPEQTVEQVTVETETVVETAVESLTETSAETAAFAATAAGVAEYTAAETKTDVDTSATVAEEATIIGEAEVETDQGALVEEAAGDFEEVAPPTELVTAEKATEVAAVAGATAVLAETSQAEAGEASVEAEEQPEIVEIPNVADIPADQMRFLKQDIEYVEGIGPVYGEKLKAIGINTSLDLLSKGATRKGREIIAEASGISGKLILRWVNHADLFRVKGVGSEWADLLEAAGVDTVVELAVRNPMNLHAKLVETNQEKKLTRQVPSAAQVEDWVGQAKQLGRVVRY